MATCLRSASILRGILQCSQKGKARFTTLNSNDGDLTSHSCNLPINLRHCKASSSGTQFAYAGTEVNLSIWDTEVAFRSASPSSPPAPTGGKRTRKSDQLFPGEIWRAKNVRFHCCERMVAHPFQVPHDYLDLRQPIDITSLAFLSVNDSGSHQSIAVGNTLGCVHSYDTRKGRKPAFSWSDSRMSGGISLVEKGIPEK
jgi:ribosome biogenesis protein NSA1